MQKILHNSKTSRYVATTDLLQDKDHAKYIRVDMEKSSTSTQCNKVPQAKFFSSIKMLTDLLLALSAARDVHDSIKSTVVQHHVGHGHCTGRLVTTWVTCWMPRYVTEQRTGHCHAFKPERTNNHLLQSDVT